MSVFDEFVTKAKSATQTAGKKANEFVELTKLRKSVFDLENEIDDAYGEIGRMVYDTYMEKASYSTEVVNAKCTLIHQKYEEMAEIEEKINSIKQIKVCPDCKQPNPLENVFCSKCGAKLEKIIEDDYAFVKEEEVVSEEESAKKDK